jgi:DEAD/DEAH box helicase domain-containing protein
VSLRASAIEAYGIEGPRGEIGTIDRLHLYREAYPGAVYLHEGERYRVIALDEVEQRVTVAPEPAWLITEPLLLTTVHVENGAGDAMSPAGVRVGAGTVQVRQTTTGFREKTVRRGNVTRTVTLSPPLTHELSTVGCWAVLDRRLAARLDAGGRPVFAAGLHALEHLLPAAVSIRLLADPRDVVAIFELDHVTIGGPVLFLYDGYEGGAGIAPRAGAVLDELLRIALQIVRDCGCKDGCPACIYSITCWRQHDDPDKRAAVALLSALVEAPTTSMARGPSSLLRRGS